MRMKLTEKLALILLVISAVVGAVYYFKIDPFYTGLTGVISYLGAVDAQSILDWASKNWQIVTGAIGAVFAIGLPIIKLYKEHQAKIEAVNDNIAMAKAHTETQLQNATNVDVLNKQLLEQQKTIASQQQQIYTVSNPNLTALQQENEYLKQELLVAQRTAADALTKLQNTPVRDIIRVQ
jgi:hypothetical protein